MLRRLLPIALVATVAAVTFLPVGGFELLNWDDHVVIVDNASLAGPDVLRWAFSTTYMEHYQPASWLLWAGLGGPSPDAARYHAANLVLHVAVVVLVLIAARRLLQLAAPDLTAAERDVAAATTALLFGVHPLRVEVVAWVSAMPYALAAVFALAAVVCWLRADPSASWRSRHLWLATLLFAASLLARPVALGLPVALATLDVWTRRRGLVAALVRVLPLLMLAAAAAAAEFVARAPGLADVPVLYKLQSALAAPFLYLGRTIAPVALTPLDPLPLTPEPRLAIIAAALAAGLIVSGLAWRARNRWPGLLAAWVAYLALLAPAAGLVPSGLQATADRYSYLPGMIIAVLLGGGVGELLRSAPRRHPAVLALVSAVILGCAVSARQLLPVWQNSRTLWTRVVTVDPRNDIGHYNLGLTLAAAGETTVAAEHYRTVLDINPQHTDARLALDRIDAGRFEQEGNELAAAGRLREASERYREALTRDPRRAHAQAARGMALAALGREGEALPHLREAVQLGVADAAVANTLAGLLIGAGQAGEARAVLEGAMRAIPEDAGLAHNLARLLISLPGLPPQDTMRAFRLAEAVVEATGGRDPRALETLAATLAANGRPADARAINARAVAAAHAQGDRELAAAIAARGKRYAATRK